MFTLLSVHSFIPGNKKRCAGTADNGLEIIFLENKQPMDKSEQKV